MLRKTVIVWLLNHLSEGIAIFLFLIGVVMYFFTERMLDLTSSMERGIGAYWIPSERTHRLYRNVGVFFLSLGALLFGYYWYKP